MSPEMIQEILFAAWETIYMVLISSFFGALVGIPLGVLLLITRPQGIHADSKIYAILSTIVNIVRSIPFIILLIAIVPFTRLLVGTSIGTTAAIVPLAIGSMPFIARIVENALNEIPKGLIEAGHAMGATTVQIIRKILIPEALPSIISGLTVVMVSLVGYSAMAGAVGGGGLGDLAIRYGYQRFDVTVMLVTIAILIVLVQVMQMIGDKLAHYVSHK